MYIFYIIKIIFILSNNNNALYELKLLKHRHKETD